jgi:predicted dehydrogenase
MSSPRIRIAVVGAGHMGALHAKKVAELSRAGEGVALAGVADLDAERARTVAGANDVPVLEGQADVVAAADAAIVAVPGVAHAAVAEPLLSAGLDVLIEKPIADQIDDAQRLIDRARQLGRVLQVGHLERFNPALRGVRERIERPRFVEAHRLGPFPGRATDVDVVRDLMIHDLDLLQHLLGEEPERIDAIGVPVLTRRIDIANARLVYPGGCVANFTASRVSVAPVRKLRLFQASGYLSIDLLAKSAVFFHRREDAAGGSPRIEMETLEIDREDALLAQLRCFVASVRSRSEAAVTGEDALRTLRTALRVVEAMPSVEQLR